jgi:hypothetical protein
MSTSTADRQQPWGRVCGLLGACIATLAGVFQQVDPDVILIRAAVCGSVVAVCVYAFRSVVNSFEAEDSLDD